MGDILSAASLLLTIVTVLYALWYQELMSALQIEVPIHKEDRSAPLLRINSMIYSRAIPLFVSSVLVSVVFIPDVVGILREAFRAWEQANRYIQYYDSVKTAVCIVVVFSIALSVHAGFILMKLLKIRHDMKK